MELNPESATAAHTTVREYIDYLNDLNYRLLVLKRDILGFYHFNNQIPFDEKRHLNAANLVKAICMPME